MASNSAPNPSVSPSSGPPEPIGFWEHPATIQPNNFIYKSLCNWAFNTAVGCGHACRFCYVPSTATIKMAPKLKLFGVTDPDEEWGDYVFLRRWDERSFLESLRSAERTAPEKLKADGNRAVLYCSTTDPYQVFRHPEADKKKELTTAASNLVRRSLELIRDESTLRVRILTRSPLAKKDFGLFKTFGNRLLFGMSLPTLRNDLAKVYEPKAPSPSQRLATLKAAKEAGLAVYVAIAPTYPECDEDDLRATLEAVKKLDPVTVFHEPINIRAENVERIRSHAREVGISLRSEVFASRESWKEYALQALQTVERLSYDVGLSERLHLWPDRSLGSAWAVNSTENPDAHRKWLGKWWNRISEWPGA